MASKFDRILSKNKIGIFIGIIIWVLISPFLLKHFKFISFGEGNSVGDAIGGITAPAIGILNAILIYLALIKQIEQSDKQANEAEYARHESNFRLIFEEIKFLNNKVDKFYFEFFAEINWEFEGKDAIRELSEKVKLITDGESRFMIEEVTSDITDLFHLVLDINRVIKMFRFKTTGEHYAFLISDLKTLVRRNFREPIQLLSGLGLNDEKKFWNIEYNTVRDILFEFRYIDKFLYNIPIEDN